MRLAPALFSVAATVLGACGSGTPVVLNERLFELPSMTFAGGGCTSYGLARLSSAGCRRRSGWSHPRYDWSRPPARNGHTSMCSRHVTSAQIPHG